MSGGDRPFMVSDYAETDHTLGYQGRRGTYGRPSPKSDIDPMSPSAGRILSIHRPSLPFTQEREQGSNSHFDGSIPPTRRSDYFHIHAYRRVDCANSAKLQGSRPQQYASYSQPRGFGTQNDGSSHYSSEHSSVKVQAQCQLHLHSNFEYSLG